MAIGGLIVFLDDDLGKPAHLSGLWDIETLFLAGAQIPGRGDWSKTRPPRCDPSVAVEAVSTELRESGWSGNDRAFCSSVGGRTS